MAQIAVDFLRGISWTSRPIAWFGLGAHGYSHAASVLKDGRYLDARSDVIAGVPAGVHIRHLETETRIATRRATLDVSDADYAAWEANLRAKITDPYGVWDIVDFMTGEAIHKPGSYICSALAINAVQHMCRSWHPLLPGYYPRGYVPYPLVWPAHEITPNAGLLILQTAGWTIRDEVQGLLG